MKENNEKKLLRVIILLQSLYYLGFGLWSLLHITSFVAFTGEKHDLWLVKTVGLLLIVCGVALFSSVFRKVPGPAAFIIGIGVACSLAGIDIVYVSNKVISAIYLLDATVEVFFILGWIVGSYRAAKNRRLRKESENLSDESPLQEEPES
jgi:hypothetical protein